MTEKSKGKTTMRDIAHGFQGSGNNGTNFFEFDIGPLLPHLRDIADAIRGIQIVVNVPDNGPVTIQVPEQPPPQVTVNVPPPTESMPPTINVIPPGTPFPIQAPPEVTVYVPQPYLLAGLVTLFILADLALKIFGVF